MVLKASINGPNRRHNRVGDHTIASNPSKQRTTPTNPQNNSANRTLSFRLRPLEKFLKRGCDGTVVGASGGFEAGDLGNAGLFTVREKEDSMGMALILRHFEMIDSNNSPSSSSNTSSNINFRDPVLIYFHDLPVFVLRVLPIYIAAAGSIDTGNKEEDIIYVSQAHCHNHKICEDTVYTVTCCSRQVTKSPTLTRSLRIRDYDRLSAVGIDVHRRYTTDTNTTGSKPTFCASQIAKKLMNHTDYSILTVDECLTITVSDTEIVCRVSRVRLRSNTNEALVESTDDDERGEDGLTSSEASMEDPYRGRVDLHTDFFISSSDLVVEVAREFPEGKMPADVIHVTTEDGEWFPVRRTLLVPCLALTKYTQAGRGKYKNEPVPILEDGVRSVDAPMGDGRPHCLVPLDCCTFDRVLLFLLSILYPKEHTFALGLEETNGLIRAAEDLKLTSLKNLCLTQTRAFESRVRKDRYFTFSEIKERNRDKKELLLLLDGMALDITRWIDEHPGGPSIIPTQALNVDATVFFEMYHVSRQSFLYLEAFYIGELAPDDVEEMKRVREEEGDGAKASEGFMRSLRSYTERWRVKVEEKDIGGRVHNSL